VCAILDWGNIPSYSALSKVSGHITLLNKILEDAKYFQIQSMKPETIGRRQLVYYITTKKIYNLL